MEGFGVSGAGGRDAVDLKSTTKIQREFESHLTHSEKTMITGIDGRVATIYLGEGTVGIANFSSIDNKGILFSQFDEPREIGDIDKVDAPYRCTGGEVVIFCTKKESALVLLEQVQRLVDSFD